jgi:hypothetical protein
MIEIERTGAGNILRFRVVVREDAGETRHEVTISRTDCERLAGTTHTPEQCIDAAFRFLLDREPKEAILRRFDVTVIPRYFSDFEAELPRYLGGGSGDGVTS